MEINNIIYTFVFALNACSTFTLGIAVYIKRKDLKNYLFFNLFIFFYSIFQIFWTISDNYSAVLFSSRVVQVGITCLPFFFLNFCFEIAEKKQNSIFKRINILLLFIFILLSLTDLIVKDVRPILNFPYWSEAGSLFPLYFLFFSINIIIGHYILIKKAKTDPKLIYIFIGTILGFSGGTTNFILFYSIPISPLGNFLISIYAPLTAYAIIKKELLDIKIAITKTISWGSIIILCLLSFSVILLFPKNLLFLHPFLASGIGLFWALSAAKLQRLIQTPLEHKFLKGQYNSELVMNQIAADLLNIENRKKILNLSGKNLYQHLQLRAAYGILPEKRLNNHVDNYIFYTITTDSIKNISISPENKIIQYFNTHKEITLLENLDKLFQDEFLKLQVLKGSLALPVYSENDFHGILILGPKASEDKFVTKDFTFFEALMHHIALIFERINQHDHLKELNLELKISNQTTNKLNIELQELNKNLEQRVKEEVSERKRALEAAEQMSYQAALSTVNSGIAHEINNPLAIIQSELEFFLRLFKNEEPAITKELIEEIIFDKGITSQQILEYLKEKHYIDEKGSIDKNFRPYINNYNIEVAQPYIKYKKPIELLLQLKYIQGKITKATKRIIESITRTIDIAENMLKYAKKRTGEKETIDLSTILEEFFNMYVGTSKKYGVEFILENCPKNSVIYGERIALIQVFLNLAKNAVQAMDNNPPTRKKSLTVSTSFESFINNQENQKVKGIKIIFSDTGCGISEKDKEKVFTPFFTKGKQRSKGANVGLGLSIVFKIINEHNGLIAIDSEQDIGTNFVLFLPLQLQTD